MSLIKVATLNFKPIIREGLKSFISDIEDIRLVGQATDELEVISIIRDFYPHILIVGCHRNIPRTLELVINLAERYGSLKLLAIVNFPDRNTLFQLINHRISAIVDEGCQRKEILEAIYSLRNGHEYFAPSISGAIMRNFFQPQDPKESLSKREYQVLKLHAEGCSNRTIARRMNISVRTVESHKSHIMQKLNFTSVVDMVKFAIKNGIIEL